MRCCQNCAFNLALTWFQAHGNGVHDWSPAEPHVANVRPEEILNAVREYATDAMTRTIDRHIYSLRDRIGSRC